MLRTNSQWKAIVLGGTYEGTTYPPLITEGIFNDFTFEYNMPYTKSRARELYNVLPNMSTLDTYEISYDYNEYLREYQNASKIKNEEITASHMALLTITKNQIAYNTIEKDQIASRTITNESRKFRFFH